LKRIVAEQACDLGCLVGEREGRWEVALCLDDQQVLTTDQLAFAPAASVLRRALRTA